LQAHSQERRREVLGTSRKPVTIWGTKENLAGVNV
jgi:hypothetical protein